MQQILALQLKRIGDLIVTAPALHRLRDRLPGASVTLVVDSKTAGLIPVLGGFDRLLVYHKGRPNFSVWRSLVAHSFDACVDFTGSDRSALMTRLGGSSKNITSEKLAGTSWKRHIYSDCVAASVREMHTIDYYQAFLTPLGIECGGGDAPLKLNIPAETDSRISDLLVKNGLHSSFALVHPGSARSEKYWDAERWARLIDHLKRERGMSCVLSGSDAPGEQAHIAEIKRQTTAGSCVDLSSGLTLPDLAALIRRSSLVLGVDTAAMHLAGMLRRPQVVLYGPTNPFHWRPRHENAVILLAGTDHPLEQPEFVPRHAAAPMSDLPLDLVLRAIDGIGGIPGVAATPR